MDNEMIEERWQPIESAPKDEAVLVYDETDGVLAAENGFYGWQPLRVSDGDYTLFPTYWMPLPGIYPLGTCSNVL